MKTSKILLALTLVLGVLTLSNCKKNEAEINPTNQIKLTINTSAVGFDADTKTLMDGLTPKWVTGDKIGVIPNDVTANAEFTSTLSEDKITASFSGTTTLVEGANTIYAYYPYSTLNGTSNTKSETKLLLPTNQSPSLTSFDGAADIMVGKPYSYTHSSGNATISDFQFMRLMSVVKVVFKNSGINISSEKVEKVTLIAGDALKSGEDAASVGNKVLSGGVKLNLTDGTFSLYDAAGGNSRRNYVVANYLGSANYTIDAAGTNCTYLMINPVTIANGDKLSFEVVTSGHKITKTITLPISLSLVGGKIYTLNVSLDDTNIAVFNHSLPYTMNTTKNNAGNDWIAAGWELGNNQTTGTFWGVRLGTSSAVGSATSLPLSGFTDYVKVTFNAVGWGDDTPKIYVSLLKDDNSELKSNFRTIAGGGAEASGTPNLKEETIMAENAKYTIVFSGVSEAKKVKIATTDASKGRFFLAYVKVETATAGDVKAPTVTTLDATNVQGQTARLNGAFNNNDSPFTDITEVGFYWKKTSDANYTKVTLEQTSYTYSTLSSLDYATEYSYYAYLKVGGSEITGAVKTFTTTGPVLTITPAVLTLGAAANSTATLTITSLAGQAWTASITKGTGFTLSATTGTIEEGGTSTITITASNANTGASTMDLGTIEVKLDGYTSSVATTTIKQANAGPRYYVRVTDNDQIVSGGSYLIVENVNGNGKVMGNTLSSSKFSLIDCSSKYDSGNDRFTSDASITDEYAVTFTTASTGYTLNFTKSGNYIIYNSSANFAALNSTIPADNKGWWTVDENGTTNLFNIKNVNTTSRSILYRAGSSNVFGPYSTSSMGSEYSFVRLYKLQ